MRRHLRSERVKLPNVQRLTRNGKTTKYHRVTRAKLPNDVPEDHPAFLKAWSAEEEKREAPKIRAKVGTIEYGCEAFLGSQTFLSLNEKYRSIIRRHVDAIRLIGGSATMKDLRSRHIEADLEPLTPAVARSRLKAWRKLTEFWTKRSFIADDVGAIAKGKKMPKTDGHLEWTTQDIQKFRDHWPIDSPQRLAFELLQWTGARISDLVRIGPGMVSDGLLTFRQTKTQGECYIPWKVPPTGLNKDHSHLMSALNHAPREMVYLTTSHGKARSQKAASSWFSNAAKQAGIKEKTAHGLRKYRMNQLAEAGKSVLEMQTWVGHSTLQEVELYTKRAERRNVFAIEQNENLVTRD